MQRQLDFLIVYTTPPQCSPLPPSLHCVIMLPYAHPHALIDIGAVLPVHDYNLHVPFNFFNTKIDIQCIQLHKHKLDHISLHRPTQHKSRSQLPIIFERLIYLEVVGPHHLREETSRNELYTLLWTNITHQKSSPSRSLRLSSAWSLTLRINLPQILDNLPQILDNLLQKLDILPQVLDNLPQILDNLPQILDNLPQILDNLPQILDNLPQKLDILPQVLDNLPQILDNLPQILDILPQILNILPQVLG